MVCLVLAGSLSAAEFQIAASQRMSTRPAASRRLVWPHASASAASAGLKLRAPGKCQRPSHICKQLPRRPQTEKPSRPLSRGRGAIANPHHRGAPSTATPHSIHNHPHTASPAQHLLPGRNDEPIEGGPRRSQSDTSWGPIGKSSDLGHGASLRVIEGRVYSSLMSNSS